MTIEKDCTTCISLQSDLNLIPCSACITEGEGYEHKHWQPSEIYTRYLEEKQRADSAEEDAKSFEKLARFWADKHIAQQGQLARFRNALDCQECGGTGEKLLIGGGGTLMKTVCPTCKNAREEARKGREEK